MNYSRQREEVLDQLSGHKDHPTADVIFAEPMPEAETLDEEAARHVPGIVTGHDLVFHGICERCCTAGNVLQGEAE